MHDMVCNIGNKALKKIKKKTLAPSTFFPEKQSNGLLVLLSATRELNMLAQRFRIH